MQLRKHQAEILDACKQIVAGAPVRDVYGLITPGGGKSALPLIAAKMLIDAGLADALCWVVPRNSLQQQAESNFMEEAWRDYLIHNNTIRASTNDPNPCRGYQGFVTTYQALGIDYQRTALQDFQRRRYILFLDEFHHCEVEDAWHVAINDLVEAAAFRFFVTGTIERGNGKKIAWVPYKVSDVDPETGTTEYRPDLDESNGKRFVVHYSRSDALAERAILPLHFFFNDAQVRFMNMNGNLREYNSLQGVAKSDASAALGTALAKEYAFELLDLAVGHWLKYRDVNPTAKLLVVSANFEHAKRFEGYLSSKWKEYNVAIATSHNPEHAARSIHNFKCGSINILVTIAMAYEGLDVPEISHIACLTHIRSTPWIEQMLARAVRVNRRPEAGPYENQIAYVFAPKDDLFMEVVQQIEGEQAPIIKERALPEQMDIFDDAGPGSGEGLEAMPAFIPLEGRLTRRTERFNFNRMMNQAPIVETPSQAEKRLKQEIEAYVRGYALQNFYNPKKINGEIAKALGKARKDMSVEELKNCLDYVKRTYPRNGPPPAGVASTSPPRAQKRRFPTTPQLWGGA